MSGMAGDSATSPEEASDPITPTVPANTYKDRARESASSMAERLMAPFQPGDTQAPARRLSDIPSGRESGEGKGEEDERKKPMLQSAQETVASALGGSSRGGS